MRSKKKFLKIQLCGKIYLSYKNHCWPSDGSSELKIPEEYQIFLEKNILRIYDGSFSFKKINKKKFWCSEILEFFFSNIQKVHKKHLKKKLFLKINLPLKYNFLKTKFGGFEILQIWDLLITKFSIRRFWSSFELLEHKKCS